MEPLTMGARLTDAAKLHVDRLALWLAGTEYSYRDLFDTACTLAAEIERTTPADAPVGILGHQSFATYVGVLAATLCGRAYAPVYPAEPLDRQKVIFGIVKPGALVCDTRMLDIARDHRETLGYRPEVILAGRRINDSMGQVVAGKTVKLLARNGRCRFNKLLQDALPRRNENGIFGKSAVGKVGSHDHAALKK